MNAEASRSLYRRRRPLEIPALAGCRGSEDARRFYERCAFQPLPEGQTTLMITLKDAGQALAGRRDINANDTSQSRPGWPACGWAWAGDPDLEYAIARKSHGEGRGGSVRGEQGGGRYLKK